MIVAPFGGAGARFQPSIFERRRDLRHRAEGQARVGGGVTQQRDRVARLVAAAAEDDLPTGSRTNPRFEKTTR